MIQMSGVVVFFSNGREYIEISVKLSVYVLGRSINSKVATKSAGCEE